VFEKRRASARFFSPLKNFEEDAQPIEYRRDPLLGIWCRVNIKRTERVKQGAKRTNPQELIESSAKGCYFCPRNLESSTPKFPEEIATEGRIQVGDSTAFPNLFPFAAHHAIVTLGERHYLALEEFEERQIGDALRASLEYFKRVRAADKEARHFTLSWNYLPPSGASIVHPHFQLIADSQPTCLNQLFLDAARRYFDENGMNYYEKLIEEERKGQRFISRTGKVSWFTSFAPLGNNEVNLIFEDVSCLTELEEAHVEAFSSGLRKVLRCYADLGIESFNLSTYSGPEGEPGNDFWLHAKMVSRPSPKTHYTSDVGFMELLHRERVLESLPEALAKKMREFF